MARKETNFKQTDIGLIPHDWELKDIVDIASISTGSQNTQDAEDGGAYPFYVRSPKVERINSYIYDTEGVVTAGDGVGVGKIFHYVNGKFGLHQRCYLIHRFDGVWAKFFYMYFSLQFYNRVMSMTAKSSVDSVRRDMIAHMLIPVPPIEEQRRIAEVLSHFDEHIDNLVALLEKRKQVKAATMHALLSGSTRLPGFTDPWEERSLSEIFSFVRGNGLSKSVVGDKGEYPCILYGQLFTTYKENIQLVVSYTDLEEGVLSKKGDVLMPASTTTSGEDLAIASALQYDGVRLGGDIIIFRPKQVIDSLFMAYIIRLLKEEITALAQGITIVHISGKRVLNLEVMIPISVEEQSAIASFLSNMDKGIEALEQEIKKYRQMKEGAMEELLTGKTRLL